MGTFKLVKLIGQGLNNTVITGGLVPKGAYDNAVDYAVGDSVDYLGSSYVMFSNAVAGVLPTDTTKWQVVANKGATGVTGATGPQGIQGIQGIQGTTGPGVVSGGTTNQVLTKINATDYNTQWSTIDKTFVGLGNVDNTSDANKPVSSATQTALDLKVDENSAITGATKTKITYDAKGLVTAGADATTSDIADSTNKRYVTDANLTVIGNTSGTNTGDQNLSGYSLTSHDHLLAAGATDVTSSAAELNILDGAILSTTELNYVDGVTSAIQTQIDLKAPLASPTFTGTVSGITKTMVGLGNVDNTSDASKPISTLTQAALDLKLDLAGGTMTGALTTTNLILSTGKIYPTSNSTTALQINKADGTTNILNIDSTNGRVGIGTTAPTARLDIRPDTTTTKGHVIRALATPTATTITNVAVVSNVATITTSAAHGYAVGQPATVTATTNTQLNGTFIIISVPLSTTFTYTLTTADVASTADTGTVTVPYFANLFDVQSSGGVANTYVDYLGRLRGIQGGHINGFHSQLLTESVVDYGMNGIYDRNELANAALRGNITVTLTGAGTFTDTAANKNTLFDGSAGNFFNISGVDSTTTKVEVVVDLLTNQSNYSNAIWQPFVQYRLIMSTTGASFMKNIVVEVSVDNITYYKPSSGAWATTDARVGQTASGYWFGAAGNPAIPGNVYRYVRFTLTDLFQDAGYGNKANIWISELGFRHASAPWSRQYVRTAGDSIFGDVSFVANGTATSAYTTKILQDGSAIFNEQGAAVNFRIESDTDVNALFIHGTNNTVQVGAATASDSAKFYVSGKISTSGEMEINGDLNHDGTNVGFYGVAPTARQLLATGAGATVDQVITALQTLGLLRQS